MISKTDKGSYISKGVYKWIDDNTLEITELPIGCWTENYKEFLEDLITKNNPYLKSFESHYTAKNVKFILKLGDYEDKEKMINELNLSSSKNLSLNNLHLFTSKGNIKKFGNIAEILIEWFKIRIYKYHTRKEKQLKKMRDEFLIISNKIRFILDVIEGNILIMNKKLKEIEMKLEERGFDKYENNYNYLLQLPISQLTADKKESLEKEVKKLEEEIKELERTSIIQIWEDELQILLEEWMNYKKEILEDYENDLKGDLKVVKKRGKK
jgi:DNA topoisomerase-2